MTNPITAEEIAEAKRLLSAGSHRSVHMGLVRIAKDLLPRLIAEREAVTDGDVSLAVTNICIVAKSAVEDRGSLPQHQIDMLYAAARDFERLARQCADMRALLALPYFFEGELTVWDGTRFRSHDEANLDWLNRRDALLKATGCAAAQNSEVGK